MTAQQYAVKVAEFVAHNNINMSEHSLEEVMKAYLEAQLAQTEEVAQQVFATLKKSS